MGNNSSISEQAGCTLALRSKAGDAEEHLRELVGALGRGDGVRLAKFVGVTPQHLSDIRLGKRGFTDKVLKKLSKFKGFPPEK